MKIKGKIEVSEYVQARLLQICPCRSVRIVIYGIAVLLFVVGIQNLILTRGSDSFFWILVLSILFCVIYFRWLFPARIRKLYMQHTAIQKPFEMDISDTFLEFKNENAYSKTKWTELHKWKETEKFFFVYSTDQQYMIFPKHWFESPEDINAFRKILENSIDREIG